MDSLSASTFPRKFVVQVDSYYPGISLNPTQDNLNEFAYDKASLLHSKGTAAVKLFAGPCDVLDTRHYAEVCLTEL